MVLLVLNPLLIFYTDSALPIGGFQFDISGANLISASGGAAAAAGFSVSASSTTNRVMGFSFSGALIPAGSGVLTTITVEGGTPCLFAEVFSGEVQLVH